MAAHAFSTGDRVQVVNPRSYYMWETGIVKIPRLKYSKSGYIYDVDIDSDHECMAFDEVELARIDI